MTAAPSPTVAPVGRERSPITLHYATNPGAPITVTLCGKVIRPVSAGRTRAAGRGTTICGPCEVNKLELDLGWS